MRKLPTVFRPLLVALLAPLLVFIGCAVDSAAKKEEAGRQVDPLVRERTLARMAEIAKPARRDNDRLKEQVEAKDCAGVCQTSGGICDRSARVCDLAADYPDSDADIHERCEWATSDCDESRGLCANCGGPARPDDY